MDENKLDSPETLQEVEEFIKNDIENNSSPPLNRAQRRALMKKMGKKKRQQLDLIGDTARKLDYIDMIQKLRELNKKKEQEENEATKD